MKPKKLIIEGLHSFKEKQDINFEVLCSGGIFGIFGTTGSGKSTILDAITLALYGNVIRANRGTYGIINSNSEKAYVCFEFELLKNGRRKTYNVERLYKRKKADPYSSESKACRLTETLGETQKVLADKDREVTSKIIEIIGLNINDFTRSVVLPQNKFQDFLMLPKAEKRDMMERLFSLEEYGRRLSEKVSKRIQDVVINIKGKEGSIAALGDISKEKLEAAQENSEKKCKLKEDIFNIFTQMEEEYTKKDQLRKLTVEYEKINKDIKELEKSSENINCLKSKLNNAKRADAMKSDICEINMIKEDYKEASLKKPSVEKELKEVTLSYNEYELKRKNIEKENEEKIPELVTKVSQLENALKIKKSIDIYQEEKATTNKKIKEFEESKDNIIVDINELVLRKEKLEDKIRVLDNEIEKITITNEYRNSIYDLAVMEDKLSDIIKDEQILKNEINDDNVNLKEYIRIKEELLLEKNKLKIYEEKNICDLEKTETQKPFERTEIIKLHEEYYILKNHCETMMNLNEEVHSEKVLLEKYIKEREGIDNLLNEYVLNKGESGTKLNENRSKYEEIKEKKEGNIAALVAKNLMEGKECPVCGSLHHPNPAQYCYDDKEFEDEEEFINNQIDILTKRIIEIDGNIIKNKEKRNTIEFKIIDSENKLNEKKGKIDNIKILFPDDIDKKDIEGIIKYVQKLSNKIQKAEENLKIWEEKLEELKVKKESIVNQKTKNNSNIDVLDTKIDFLQKKLGTNQHKLEKNLLGKKELNYKFNTIVKEYSITSAKQEKKRILKNDLLVKESENRKVETTTFLEETNKKINKEKENLSNKEKEMSILEIEYKSLNNRLTDNINSLINICPIDTDISGKIQGYKTEILKIKNDKENVQKELVVLSKNLDERKTKYSNLLKQIEIYIDNLSRVEKRLDEEICIKEFKNIEEVQKSILDKEKMDSIEKEINIYEKELVKLQNHLETTLKKLDNNKVEQDDWNNIKEKYFYFKIEKDKSISEFEKAKNALEYIQKSYEEYKKYEKELKTFEHKKDKLVTLQKLLKGNSFIEFITEERLRYVTAKASDILGTLTKYRYNLEVDVNNDFVVRDNLNGGICRLVSTLSGGEVFLASLSLALSLSEQIQLKGQAPLEFFFLDEGFGTLDYSLLDTVMDALFNIVSDKRTIGLISHVPELRERVPRKLIVTPPDSYGEGSKVKVFK